MNDGREFASIIKNHVQVFSTLECSQSLLNTRKKFLRSFAFPSKDRNASRSDTEINALHIDPSQMGMKATYAAAA